MGVTGVLFVGEGIGLVCGKSQEVRGIVNIGWQATY